MPYKGSPDLSIDLWGGLVLDMDPSDLPAGASPDNQNVIYSETGPRTRPGLGGGVFLPIAGNPKVNYLKTFIMPDGSLRALVQDSGGNLWEENPFGTLALVYAGLEPGIFATSVTAFGREWLAMGDGFRAVDIPRQFDGTNFDRVTQDGPGASPNVQDTGSFTIAASPTGLIEFPDSSIAASPVGATQVGNVCAIQLGTAVPAELRVGDQVKVAGVGVAGYNGTWTVTVIGANAFSFVNTVSGLAASGGGTASWALVTATVAGTSSSGVLSAGLNAAIAGATDTTYNGTWNVRSVVSFSCVVAVNFFSHAASGGGTLAIVGNVIAGEHQVSVIFVTRQGYLTRAAPPASWTAAGGKAASLTNIPTGPSNVIQRIILFTGAAQANFFYIPPGPAQTTLPGSSMVINDNTTTAISIDFSDNLLFSGTSADIYFDIHVLAECAGVALYSDRMFWWGEINKIDNMLNLSFDGGFSGNVPLGWTLDPTSGAGGSQEAAQALWGFAYKITGDGVTAVRGKISQSVFQDFENVPIFETGIAYSVRCRVRSGGGLAAGTLHLKVAGSALDLAIPATSLTTSYQLFSGELWDGTLQAGPGTVLQALADGTPTNGGYFLIDEIELYPTHEPVSLGLVRASSAGLPEQFLGTTGFLEVSQNDDLGVAAGFTLRDNRLYIVKQRGLYVTQDDQSTEPSDWEIDQVSSRVGTPSSRGVGVGEDWAVIAARDGLYVFWGPEPQKISQEIQPLWDTINWQSANTIWGLVDIQQRRIRIGVPISSATSPSLVLYLDYRDLDTAADIAENPPIHISYTGRKIARDNARKWSQWPIQANCCALIERSNGTAEVWFGNGTGTGKIYKQDVSNLDDDGAAIDSYYWTAPLPSNDQEQMMQLGAQRKLFDYLTLFVEGSGKMRLKARVPSLRYTLNLPPLTLASPAIYDQGRLINIPGSERMSFGFETKDLDSWFRIARFSVAVKPDPMVPVRGF